MSMTGKCFLDTNFLIYCFSQDEPEKQEKCLAFLRAGKGSVEFVSSTQVLKEFTAVMIGKFKQPPLEVKAIIDSLSLFEVVSVDLQMIKDAIDIHVLHQISFWDSLILVAAGSAQCHTVLTEDMQHGAEVAGVRIQNPFA